MATNPPLKKVTPAPAPTVKTTAATVPLPSAPASSSEEPKVEPIVPGPQPGDGPLVEVSESSQIQQLSPNLESPEQTSNFQSFDLNGPAPEDPGLDAPAPIQNDHTPDLFEQGLLPPKPENLPDGGDCHIMWPGDPITIDGRVVSGVLITNKRHYQANLAPGSKTRWTFRLLYAAGAEVRDRRMIGQLIGRQVVTEQPVGALSAP